MTLGVRDPYEVLGVSRDATDSDIRAAFRRLAVQHHPDRNPGDPEAHARFQEINQAQQILSDAQKRAAYDRYGPAAFQPGGQDGFGGGFSDLGGLEGIFGDILGAFGIRSGPRGDLKRRLSLSFQEAARGTVKEVTYQRLDICPSCDGRGAERNTEVRACPACGGSGRVRFQQGLFPLAVERPCGQCAGRGQIPRVACPNCRGKGVSEQSRTIEVTIPAGIEHGASRVVQGGGHRTHPDRPGFDLELVVEVKPDPFFRRVGDDILCSASVSFTQATLGGEIEVPTLDGKVKLRVPPGTQPGQVLRVRGRGVPHRVRSGRGDQLVEVQVEVPTNLGERARELIAQLGQELGENLTAQADDKAKPKGLVDKLKSIFQ